MPGFESKLMKGKSVVRFKKYYTVKQWKEFDYVFVRDEKGEGVTMQEYLCNTYECFLTDYLEKPLKNRKQRFDESFDNFIFKLNKGIAKFNKFMDQFSRSMNSFSMAATKHEKGIKKKPYGDLMGQGKPMDYSLLTGKKSEKPKKRKKKSKKKRRHVQKDTGPDYSIITGHRDYGSLLGKSKIKIR